MRLPLKPWGLRGLAPAIVAAALVTGPMGTVQAQAVSPSTTPAAQTSTEAPVLLSEGVTSSRVATLQQSLDINRVKDYFATAGAGPYFSVFTAETTSALKAWQSDNGFPSTGTITTNSPEWNTLIAGRGSVRKISLGQTLSQGATDPAVRTLQAALHLNLNGSQYPAFTTGVYDTYFGPLVRLGLIKWQKANGHNPTGTIQIGSAQWQQLIESQSPTPVRIITPTSLRQGMTSADVKTLQTYLDRHKHKDFQPYANSVYDTYFGPSTADGLKQIQTRLGYPSDGTIEVNTMEWHHLRLSASTVRPGKVGATLKSGVKSSAVTVLQQSLARNKQKAYFGGISGFTKNFGSVTTRALKGWQKANGYPANGVIVVNSIQWGHLQSQAGRPPSTPGAKRKTRLDSRCYTKGTVICASKKDRKVYYVRRGKIIKTLDARFGGQAYDVNGRLRVYQTAEGTFSVTRKVKNEISYRYNNTPMPFSLYFYKGQAIHYSSAFARQGWSGATGSHGCVNLRDWAGAQWLFNNTPSGTKVVVYK